MGETGQVVSLRLQGKVECKEQLRRNSRTDESFGAEVGECPKDNFESAEIRLGNVAQTRQIVDEFVGEIQKFSQGKVAAQSSVLLCKIVQTGVEKPSYKKSCDTVLYTGPSPVESQKLLGRVTSSEEMLALKGMSEGEKEAAAALPKSGAARGYGALPGPADRWYNEEPKPATEPAVKEAKPLPKDSSNVRGAERSLPFPRELLP